MSSTIDPDLNLDEALATSPATLPKAVARFFNSPTPFIIGSILMITAAYRVYLGGFEWFEIFIPIGLIAFWPFQEWLIHVFVLHFKPVKLGRFTFDLPVAKKHRAHHRAPWKLSLVFMPLHSFVAIVPLMFGLWIGILPTIELALTGIGFHLFFTLHYEWVHFLVHTRYRPKSWLYARMWRNHRLHHCKNEHYWMGVTTMFGDLVLGTLPTPTSVPLSETCRTLGVEE